MKNGQYDIPLQETQRAYEEQLKSVDSMKQAVRTIFGASSLIVSLSSGLQLFSGSVSPEWQGLYLVGVVFAAALYVALIALCIWGMWPVGLSGPILMEWDVLAATFADMTEEERKAKHMSCLLNAIDLNKPKVVQLARLERAALVVLPVLVTLLLLLAFLPRA